MSISKDKAALRETLRRRRTDFVADPARRGDMLVSNLFVAEHVTARFGAATTVAGYIFQQGEVDPLPILLVAIDRGLATVLPRVTDRDAPMRFHHWLPGDDLVPGPLGLLQPRADAPEMAPDMILTPLLGFDRELRRLGQGAGFYDRAFVQLPAARRIGLAWSMQEEPEIPTESWDIPLHAVATEREWIGR